MGANRPGNRDNLPGLLSLGSGYMLTASVTVTAQAQGSAHPTPDVLRLLLLEIVKNQRTMMATVAEFNESLSALTGVVAEVVDVTARLRADVARLTDELAAGGASSDALASAKAQLDELSTQIRGALPQ